DPVERARYDVQYTDQVERSWRIFDQTSALDDVEYDRRMRSALLAILYTARRNDAEHAGMGEVDLERLLGCPEIHLRFHVWHLRETRLIQSTASGPLAI